jgi:hypothetical protein
MARASSGSRSSINSIEPLMSANSAVTVLRSPSNSAAGWSAVLSLSDAGTSVLVTGRKSEAALGDESRGAAHSPQKRAAGEFSNPHFAQHRLNGAAHCSQNFSPSGFSAHTSSSAPGVSFLPSNADEWSRCYSMRWFRRIAVRTVRSFYCRPEKTRTRSAKIFSLPGTDEPRLARMKFLGAGVIRRGMRDQIGILLRDPFRDRVSRIGQRGRYFRIGRLRALRAPLVGHHVFDKPRAVTARSWRRRGGGSLRVLEQLEREGPHQRMSRFRQFRRRGCTERSSNLGWPLGRFIYLATAG